MDMNDEKEVPRFIAALGIRMAMELHTAHFINTDAASKVDIEMRAKLAVVEADALIAALEKKN